jgi:hypothetical protein
VWLLLPPQSVAGTAHTRDGTVCQDYSAAVVTAPREEHVLVLTCADGAGSASRSEIGSRLACETLLRRVTKAMDAGLEVAHIERATAITWFAEVREEIGAEASSLGLTARDLACTLLLAVVGKTCAAFAQVGDGAIVVGHGTALEVIFWPGNEEALNLTQFVSDPDLEASLQFQRLAAEVDDAALLTDGLQLLALDYRTHQPQRTFFEPMFRELRSADSPDDLVLPLRQFLDSDRVNKRTDDDKTLVLASRKDLNRVG